MNRTDWLANQFLLVPKKKSWASGDGKEAGGHQVQCAPFPDGEPRAHSPGECQSQNSDLALGALLAPRVGKPGESPLPVPRLMGLESVGQVKAFAWEAALRCRSRGAGLPGLGQPCPAVVFSSLLTPVRRHGPQVTEWRAFSLPYTRCPSTSFPVFATRGTAAIPGCQPLTPGLQDPHSCAVSLFL